MKCTIANISERVHLVSLYSRHISEIVDLVVSIDAYNAGGREAQ